MGKIKIKKHGKYYIPKKEIVCCPECGYTLDTNDYDTLRDSNWEFLTIFRVETTDLDCECPNCDCQFDTKLKKEIVETDWGTLLPLILLFIFGGLIALGIVLLCLHHYVIGTILTIIFAISIIIDVGVLAG